MIRAGFVSVDAASNNGRHALDKLKIAFTFKSKTFCHASSGYVSSGSPQLVPEFCYFKQYVHDIKIKGSTNFVTLLTLTSTSSFVSWFRSSETNFLQPSSELRSCAIAKHFPGPMDMRSSAAFCVRFQGQTANKGYAFGFSH